MGKHFDFKTTPKVDIPEGVYLADFLTDKAVDFIARHKDEPFLLCLHHFAVHSPWDAKEDLIDTLQGPPAAGGHDNPTYAAMIASVDESVGRIRDKLDETGPGREHAGHLHLRQRRRGRLRGGRPASDAGSITDNAPLRSGKGSLYEGGVRVPYLFAWPGTIDARHRTDLPINSVDLYPTLLELAGASADARSSRWTAPATWPCSRTRGPVRAQAPLLALPRLPGRGPRPVADHAGERDSRRRLEAARVPRRRPARTLQPAGRHRRTKNLAATNPEKAKQLYDQLTAWRERSRPPCRRPGLPGNDQTTPKKKGAGKAARKKAAQP